MIYNNRLHASLALFTFWSWRHNRLYNVSWDPVIVTRSRESDIWLVRWYKKNDNSKNVWCVRIVSETFETVLIDSQVPFTVSLHTPWRSCLFHTRTLYQQNLNCSCLVNLIKVLWHFFIFVICFHALMNLSETFKGKRHSEGVADVAVTMLLWRHTLLLWRHRVWIPIATRCKNALWIIFSEIELNCL